MNTDENQSTTSNATPRGRPRRLWVWFVSGFLLVFLGLLILFPVSVVHSSGQFAVVAPLWRYYIEELRPHFAMTHTNLGPGTRDGSGLLVMLFVHSLISALGGGVGAGVGWCIGGREKRGV